MDDCFLEIPKAVKVFPSGATGEELRFWLRDRVGYPPHCNRWGLMIRQAIRKDLLIPTDRYVPMQAKKSHGRSTRVYRINGAKIVQKNLWTKLKKA